jgi:hypothetical protein
MKAIKEEAIKNGTWMKAPNGKATNLDEEQWVRVRTKAFKKWFGDWELANLYNRALTAWNDKNSKGKVVMGLSERAKNRFGELLGTNVKQLVITDDAIRHIKKKHGEREELRGQKNMTPEDVVVIPYLINNFDSMELDPQFDDNKGNRAVTIRKRINGVSVIATIERGENKEFLVTSYQYVRSDALDALNETPGLNVRNDSDIANVQKEIEEIKSSALNSSKVVDENGEPLVVYHSGASDIKEFSHEYDKTGIGRQFWGGGFYFGTVRSKDEWARRYEEKTGKQAKIYPIFLNLRNPKYSALGKSDINNYDGAILPSINTHEGKTEPIYIATSPNQIKSATENNGEYSGENNDIRFRSVSEELRETTEETMFSVKGYNPIAEKEVENIVVDTNGVPYSKDVALNKIPIGGLVKTNIDTGKNIKVSRKSLRHSALHDLKAVYAAFDRIEDIVVNAVKIGEIPVANDEIGKTNSVSIFYIPINIDGVQYSARLVVKELINKDEVLDDLSLYNMAMHKEKTPSNTNVGTSNDGLVYSDSVISVYKVKDLIHNTQEIDKKILGIDEETRFRFIGEKGAANLDKAEEATTRIYVLV